MLNNKEIIEMTADAYHQAALKNSDMINATNSLETIRKSLISEKKPYKTWIDIDIQIANSEEDNLRETLAELRNDYRQRILKATTTQLEKAFKKNKESAWKLWLNTYAEALTAWRIYFVDSICKTQFPFLPENEKAVKIIRKTTKYIIQQRWTDTYTLYIYLAEQSFLPPVIRAKLYVIAGEIQLYHYLKQNKARELFELAEELAPNEARVSCGWGEYWTKQDDLDRAIECFQRTIELDPYLADGYIKMGGIHESRGNYSEAMEWYEESIKNTGDGIYSLLHLYESPDIYQKYGKTLPEHINLSIVLNPQDQYSIYEIVGNIYIKNDQHEEAFRWYEKAIGLDRKRISGYTSVGYAYLEPEIQNFEKARKSFQKVVELAPDAFDGYWGLTWTYENQGKWEEAVKWYEKSLKYRPEWEGIILAKIGEMYLKMGKYAEAEEKLIEALRTDHEYDIASRILKELADKYYIELVDFDSAIRIYSTIREIHGESYEAEFQNLIGNVYYYFGRYKEAIIAYRKAVTREPENATYNSNLGGAYRELGELRKAIISFEKAIEFDPENDYYITRLGKIYYMLGEYEKAIKIHENAIKINPEEAVHYANLGLAYRDLKKPRKAEAEYLKAISLEPRNADYHNGLGVVYYSEEKYKKSIKKYKEAIEIDSQVGIYHSNLGLSYRKLEKWKEAEKAYLKAIELEPDNAENHNELGILYYSLEKLEKSVECYKNAIRIDPNLAVYYANLGNTYGQIGKFKEAEKSYLKALRLEPDNTESLNSLGMIYYLNGEIEKSIKYYQKAIENDPDVALFYINLGTSYSELEMWDEVEETCLMAVKLEPENAEYNNRLGVVRYTKGDLEQSINCYNKAIDIDPKAAVYHANLGLTLVELKRWEEAEKAYLTATKLDPHNADYHNRLGNIFYNINNPERDRNELLQKSIDCYKKAIENETSESIYYTNLGLVLGNLEEWKEAEEAYLKAVDLEPDNPENYNGLGVIYYSNGDYENAIDMYRKAIDISPDIAVYHANLGLVLGDLGRYEEAKELYTKVLELEPDNLEYQNLLHLLNDLIGA